MTHVDVRVEMLSGTVGGVRAVLCAALSPVITYLLVAARATSTNHSCELSLSVPWNTYSLPHTCRQASSECNQCSVGTSAFSNTKTGDQRYANIMRTVSKG